MSLSVYFFSLKLWSSSEAKNFHFAIRKIPKLDASSSLRSLIVVGGEKLSLGGTRRWWLEHVGSSRIWSSHNSNACVLPWMKKGMERDTCMWWTGCCYCWDGVQIQLLCPKKYYAYFSSFLDMENLGRLSTKGHCNKTLLCRSALCCHLHIHACVAASRGCNAINVTPVCWVSDVVSSKIHIKFLTGTYSLGTRRDWWRLSDSHVVVNATIASSPNTGWNPSRRFGAQGRCSQDNQYDTVGRHAWIWLRNRRSGAHAPGDPREDSRGNHAITWRPSIRYIGLPQPPPLNL